MHAEQNNTWSLETQNQTNMLHPGGRQLLKYTNEQDADLISMLKQDYDITIDWGAAKYIGLTIEWDFENNQAHTHMPGVFGQSPHSFQTQGTQTETELTASPCLPKLWSQRTIHRSGRRPPPPQQR
jgi:hypothetical protein